MSNTTWIPKTKLMPPQSVVKILPRRHLISRVHHALRTCRLTLLSAPAGSGKTTLAVQAIRELENVPVAWLRLSEDENELQAFFYALISAWNQVLPEQLTHTTNLLENFSEKITSSKSVLVTLINDLITTQHSQLVLVLDDYHVIHNSAVHNALMYLLDNSPTNLHILITTRVNPPLPLERLRLRGQLMEIRLNDMKFDLEEIRTYFKQLWMVDLTPTEGQLIYERTGGWAASLHLLALTFQRLNTPSQQQAFITQFSGSNRLVYQLLAEEVLAHQPKELRQFLLETSILSELTPRLCRAVTDNPRAPELLDEAYCRNLFLIATDNGAAYRYHDLFAEFLQHQLAEKSPELLKELHNRAAQAHTDPAEKIRHYIAARQWNDAANVLEREGKTLLAYGYFQLLQRWLTTLPPQLVQRRPYLMYLLGTSALQLGDFTTAEQYLEQALQGFRTQWDESAQGQTLLMLANAATAQHDYRKTFSYLQQALTKPLSPYQQVQAHITSAWMHVYAGNLNHGAQDSLMQAMRIAKVSSNLAAHNILGLQLRAPLLFSELGVAPFEQYCRGILKHFGETTTPATTGTLSLMSIILLMKGKLDEARKVRQRAQKMNQALGYFVYITIDQDFSELWDHLFRRDFQQFEIYWHKRLAFYEQTEGARQWLACFLFLQGLQLYLDDRIEQTRRILEQMNRELLPEDLPENYLTTETLSGMLFIHQHQWSEAEEVLQQAVERLKPAPYGLLFANPYLWLAHLYRRRGQERQARAALEELFSRYRMKEIGGILLREGAFVGPLLELVENHIAARRILRLWRRFYTSRAVPIPHSLEALTPREMEVLRLLAQGASNQEIAETLFITVRTVKAHVSRILAKMGVKSRTRAVSKAQQLDLI
jgi:LuxR family maltose regulon positive regulatory protein